MRSSRLAGPRLPRAAGLAAGWIGAAALGLAGVAYAGGDPGATRTPAPGPAVGAPEPPGPATAPGPGGARPDRDADAGPEGTEPSGSRPAAPRGPDVREATDSRGATPPPDASVGSSPSGGASRRVGPFSTSGGTLPEGWEPLLFEKIPTHTRYTLVQEDDRWVVRADADASASGLTRKIDLDLRRYPIVRWRWKVKGVLEKGDVTRKAGDDYPARIYIAFAYEPERVGFLKRAQYVTARALFGDLPIGAINYIWASHAERGGIYDNPFAGSFVKMIAVESGAARSGTWVEETRDVYADYVEAFGEEPPRIEGVAIMTDTDNTGEAVTAWYGDIEFLTREALEPGEAPDGPAAPGETSESP